MNAPGNGPVVIDRGLEGHCAREDGVLIITMRGTLSGSLSVSAFAALDPGARAPPAAAAPALPSLAALALSPAEGLDAGPAATALAQEATHVASKAARGIGSVPSPNCIGG
jgi:hypothetical protein